MLPVPTAHPASGADLTIGLHASPQTPTTRLAYDDEGRGIPLALLHAFPLSRMMWEAERAAFAGSCRIVIPDLPGFGRSPRQASPSIPHMASSVLALLDDLGVREPAIVAGLSMGGYVAFEIVRQAPERVKALGLFSTRAVPDTPEQRERRLKIAERIRQDGARPFATSILPNLLGRTTLAQRPELAERLAAQIARNDPDGVVDALLAMAQRQDSTDLLPLIRCPVMVIAGDEDALIPVAQAEDMRRRIPGATLEVIRQAGHLVNVEQPEPFQRALEQFVRRVRCASRSA